MTSFVNQTVILLNCFQRNYSLRITILYPYTKDIEAHFQNRVKKRVL